PDWLLYRRGLRPGATFPGLAAFFENIGLYAARRRWLVVSCVVIVIALTPLGLRRLIVQDSWADEFDRGSEFWRATQMVNTNFYGMHLLFVCVDASEPVTGELAAPPNSLNRIMLPGNICNDLQEMEGSAITLSSNPANAATPRVWHSHIRLLQ